MHFSRFSWFRLGHSSVLLLAWGLAIYATGYRFRQPAIFGRYSSIYVLILSSLLAVAVLLTTTLRKSIYDRLYASRREVLLCVFSCVIAALTIEAAIRVGDVFGMSFYDEAERHMRDLVPDPALSYRHQFGLRVTYQGVEVSINELGLRERPLSPKSSAKHRILLLGDSVTFGWGVPIDQTYGRRLESELGRMGRRVETINTGVNGYNTVQEFEFLKLRGDQIEPDTVMLLFVENDLNPVISLPGRRSLWQGPLYWLTRSRAFRFAYVMLPSLMGYRDIYPADTEPWRRSMSALAGIHDYCQSRGIQFVTFVYRPRADPQTDRIWKEVSALAVTRGFAATDVSPWFQGVDLHEIMNSRVDVHPNAKGHEILARGMATFLVRSVWGVPREPQASASSTSSRE